LVDCADESWIGWEEGWICGARRVVVWSLEWEKMGLGSEVLRDTAIRLKHTARFGSLDRDNYYWNLNAQKVGKMGN
jgi:hypothetical protein